MHADAVPVRLQNIYSINTRMMGAKCTYSIDTIQLSRLVKFVQCKYELQPVCRCKIWQEMKSSSELRSEIKKSHVMNISLMKEIIDALNYARSRKNCRNWKLTREKPISFSTSLIFSNLKLTTVIVIITYCSYVFSKTNLDSRSISNWFQRTTGG